MNPIPNLATRETPAAFVFGYMYANPSQDEIIKKYWPEGSSAFLDPVGPSPLLIHREQLAKVHANPNPDPNPSPQTTLSPEPAPAHLR